MNRKQKNHLAKQRLFTMSALALMFAFIGALVSTALGYGSELGLLGLAAAPVVVVNTGRQINYISGIQGVATGGTALINLPTNRRYHRISLFVRSNAAVDDVTDVISTIKVIVNGIAVRDISPTNILKIAMANGYIPTRGELPIMFTEPWVQGPNINEPSDALSWDMEGQSTFRLEVAIKSGLTAPELAGIYEFDYKRNTLPNGAPFLQPVAMHEYTLNLVAGRNNINTIPFDFPIRRLWFQGGTNDHIIDLELEQDGNRVLEGTAAQLKALYRPYGFKFDDHDFDSRIFAAGTSDATLATHTSLEGRLFFDLATIFDVDGRWWKSLRVGKSFIVKINSTSAQAMTVVAEVLPGAFAN